ncbi:MULTISPECIES: GNAT family N-acetyltransferase [unclassified Ectothiorhodospira]|uniref:GNAT family N-acetyltransferase n=1 Tax=unclassified Ectothiorhodospira TaxID=2684909 RepID=UPI001EE84FCC|nr:MULTISPECIES: GNAT family N-acyltransferase [unclassified Ectothiorhodospira]MCG5516758.1 GNAT family N-acetyltransferase [Ectothiorhodospira sp. 9100]MCG5519198.1 GNAT family N-acetyltransferase [Ectothiorhodospira sp. 9905]
MQTAILNDSQWNVPRHQLRAELARDEADIMASQRLRYQVFAEEMGAELSQTSVICGLDQDRYDRYCHHLLVRDTQTGAAVASTRILLDQQARLAGGFYSENEFQLGDVAYLKGRVMEVGRTCVHPEYRNGAAIGVLWSGLAQFMSSHRVDHLIGCASIPMHDGGRQARAIMERLREKHLVPEALRVEPRLPLPPGTATWPGQTVMPPLLKAYLRLGARIGGEPCWDPDFRVADVFILLNREDLPARYQRHFLRAVPAADVRPMV